VLIELPRGEGVVRREDGEIVVTRCPRRRTERSLRRGDSDRPVKTWLDGERSLVGGVLSTGALSAEVVDGRGVRLAARGSEDLPGAIDDLAARLR